VPLLKLSQVGTRVARSETSSGMIWCQAGAPGGLRHRQRAGRHADAPVLLILDGPVQIHGVVFGFVFIRDTGNTLNPATGQQLAGNCPNNCMLQMNAGSAIYGALVLQGQMKVNGTSAVIYDGNRAARRRRRSGLGLRDAAGRLDRPAVVLSGGRHEHRILRRARPQRLQPARSADRDRRVVRGPARARRVAGQPDARLAEAKVRGRVVAMLSARMDELRGMGYGNCCRKALKAATSAPRAIAIPLRRTTPTGSIARAQAGRGHAQPSTQQRRHLVRRRDVREPGAALERAEPARRAVQAHHAHATWIDATNNPHTLSMASDVSAMALTNNIVVPPEPVGAGGQGPIVRTTDPATAGVIPIAISTQSTARRPTRPRTRRPAQQPADRRHALHGAELHAAVRKLGGHPEALRERSDQVQCKYGAGGNNLPEIYRTAQWPAVWTGDRYDVHVPDGAAAAPGQSFESGPKSGRGAERAVPGMLPRPPRHTTTPA
jgi:hypothetical protein